MANNSIGLDEPATIDKRLQTYDGTVSAVTVHREVVVLGDYTTFGDTGEGTARIMTSAPAGTEGAIVVRNIPSGTQTVSGTITANAGTGVFDVTPASPLANDYLPVRVTDGTNFLGTTANPVITRISDGTDSVLVTAAGALVVDGTGVTQPVSGTVTANAGTGVFDVTPVSPVATDYLPARITDGSAFLDPREGARDTIVTGNITALNGTVVATTEGKLGASVLLSGTWSATAVFEVSNDNSTWKSVYVQDVSIPLPVLNTTFNNLYTFYDLNGISHIRVRASIFTSGQIDVRFLLNSNKSTIQPYVYSESASATSVSPIAVVGGKTAAFSTEAVEIATSAPGGAAPGFVVRNIPSGTQTVSVSNALTITTFPDNEPFNLNQYGGTATTLGQKTMTASMPVVIASDQSAVSVSGTGVFDVTPASPVATDYLPARITDGSVFLDPREGVRDSVTTGTMAALDAAVSAVVEGKRGVSILLTGTWSATVNFEVSNDNTNWFVFPMYGSDFYNPYLTTTGNGLFFLMASAGVSHVRVRSNPYTSGTVNVRIVLTEDRTTIPLVRDVTSTFFGLPIAGYDTTSQPRTLTLASGAPGAGDYGVVVRQVGSLVVTQATASSLNAEVQGNAAHDVAVSGNPLFMGARANANEPTAVQDGDNTHLWADLLGRLVVVDGHPTTEAPVTANGSASGTSVIAAPGAGVSLYIKKGSMHNRAATETVVSLREGAAGTIRFTANLAADRGGTIFDFGSAGWKLPANTALIADIGQASVDVNITDYYIAA